MFWCLFHQAGKWQFAKWKIGHYTKYFDKKKCTEDLTRGKELYPLLVVVECKCKQKLQDAAATLLDYASGAAQYRVENIPDTTSDLDALMNKKLYEQHFARMIQGTSKGTKPRSQATSQVPTKVSKPIPLRMHNARATGTDRTYSARSTRLNRRYRARTTGMDRTYRARTIRMKRK